MFYDKQSMFGPGWPFMSLFVPLISLVVVDLILRGMALWKSARSEQKGWFIALMVLNTMGLLPLIYLVFFQKKNKKK